jgi:hypothetical protein
MGTKRVFSRAAEQGFQLQNQSFVERCLPGQAEPVAFAADTQAELPAVYADDANALALGPLDRGDGR